MSNETTTPETISTVEKSTCLSNHTTVSESSHEGSSVDPNSEVETIVTSEKIVEDSTNQRSLTYKNNFKPGIKENSTEISQCNTSQEEITSPVSLTKMKQKLFKAMHSGGNCCNGCGRDLEIVNNCSDCENESVKSPPIPNSPLLDHVLKKLLKENVDTAKACDASKESENNVDVTEDIGVNTKTGAVTPVRTNSVSKHVLAELKRNNIHSKIDALLIDIESSSGSEDEIEKNSFIETMAEEGEEDTPSEGSNDIIEVGEEICTTESELSSDESYENNSFIDDDENCQLLSGEEYDLSLEEPKQRRRIIQLSCDSDDEIVRIPKKEKIVKKPKKSRIIRFEDSSDEELPQAANVTDLELSQDVANLDQNGSNTKSESYHNNESVCENLAVDVEKNENNFKLESCGKNESVCQDLEVEPQNMNDRSETSDLEESNNLIKSENLKENENIGKDTAVDPTNDRSQMCDLEKENEEKQSKKIIILENIRISDVNVKNLSQQMNDVINSKVKTTCDINVNGGGQQNLRVGTEEVEASLTTPVNNCKSPVISKSTESVTGSGRKKRKRRDKQKKTMKKASVDWTEERVLSTKMMHSDSFKNYFKFNVENPDSYTGDTKKSKKRKRLDSNNSVCDVEPLRKKKKKNKMRSNKQKDVAIDTHANILQQPIVRDSETLKRLFDSNGVDENWKVAKRTLKPSQISEESGRIKVHKKGEEIKLKSLSSKVNKLYQTDFKNLMLCHNGNIKRVETKQLLRKKN